LKNTGHAVPINDAVRKQRVELGLEELPPTMYKFKDEKNSDLKKIEKYMFDLPPVKEEKKDKKKDEESS